MYKNKYSKFIYFPSFSGGEFGNGLEKNHKFRDKQSVRFYSDEYPEEFRYKNLLITAGSLYKRKTYYEDMNFKRGEHLIMGDSGGYQILTGVLKWNEKLKVDIFNWLENNSDVAMNLDIPPRGLYEGKYYECLEVSKDNFKYFADNQTGKTKFLNVIHGTGIDSYQHWYNNVKDFEFNGWGVGGLRGAVYPTMSSLAVLLEGKEHLKLTNEYLHILGTSRINNFLILLQLQKSLSEVGSNMVVTTDSSTPDRVVVFGGYYIDFSLAQTKFDLVNLPRTKHREGVDKEIELLANKDFIKSTSFDEVIRDLGINMMDVANWTRDGQYAMRLHNFHLFLDAIEQAEELIYGLDDIKEQLLNKDLYQVLHSIDEMVKSDDPMKVFEKYKTLYTKMSSAKDSVNVNSNHGFF